MQVELLEAKTETSVALWGGGGRGDECRHLSRHGFEPTADHAGSMCGLGFCPFLVLRHEIPAVRPPLERPPGKRPGTEALDLGRGSAWWPCDCRPGGIPLSEGEGHRIGAEDSASGLSWHLAVSRKRVLRVMRENNLLSPHRCRRPWRKSPCSVRSSPMPPTSCGARTCVRVFTVDDGWGWIFTAIEHWNAECRRLACVQARRPLRRPISRSPWGLRGCMPRHLRPVRRGGWPCGWITAPSICRSHVHQPDQVLGHPAVLRLRSNSPRPTSVAERFNRTLKEQIDPWPHLPTTSRSCLERRPRVRRTVQCPVDRGEERLPEPRSSSSGVAHRDVTQARRMRQNLQSSRKPEVRYDVQLSLRSRSCRRKQLDPESGLTLSVCRNSPIGTTKELAPKRSGSAQFGRRCHVNRLSRRRGQPCGAPPPTRHR